MHNYITTLITVLLILSFASLYYHHKNLANQTEYFYQIDDDDDDDEIVFTEDMIENVQPTQDQLMAKKQLRHQLQMEKEKEIQLRRQLELEQQKELNLSKQLQQLDSQFDSHFTPDYSNSSNCTNRCNCCWKNSQSSDRMEACNKKYKFGSKELNECLYSNSKYAHEACKSKFGKGLIFKTC
jgi:hypothetical protein